MEYRFDGVQEEKCNAECTGGNMGQFCGGPTGEQSVYIAECPAGETRFADHCYFMSPAGSTTIVKHQDACTEVVRLISEI